MKTRWAEIVELLAEDQRVHAEVEAMKLKA